MPLVAEAASRLRVKIDTPGLRDLVAEISWAKVSNVNAEDYPRLAVEHNRRIASDDPKTVSRIFASYEKASVSVAGSTSRDPAVCCRADVRPSRDR